MPTGGKSAFCAGFARRSRVCSASPGRLAGDRFVDGRTRERFSLMSGVGESFFLRRFFFRKNEIYAMVRFDLFKPRLDAAV
jgi:hypothetical protein